MTAEHPPGSAAPGFVPFGRVTRAHGVRGELRLEPFARGDRLPEACHQLRLITPTGAAHVYDIAGARPADGAVLLTLAGVADRDAAASLKGCVAELPSASLPPAAPGEHYSFELIGAEILDEAGVSLGVVRAVMDNSGQELLELDTPSGKRLFPLVPQTFLRFERAARRLWIRDVAGLFQLPPER